ncbi:hypothetical protein JCM18918_1553 [Cutibacterium acnes JCM 18918]|nr:hypothetical protein JCM18918_1553 [Cutibacterium acnes JCM 18918]
MDAGTITDHKALRGLTEEIEHLGRRISRLEDDELDAMQPSRMPRGPMPTLIDAVLSLTDTFGLYWHPATLVSRVLTTS